MELCAEEKVEEFQLEQQDADTHSETDKDVMLSHYVEENNRTAELQEKNPNIPEEIKLEAEMQMPQENSIVRSNRGLKKCKKMKQKHFIEPLFCPNSPDNIPIQVYSQGLFNDSFQNKMKWHFFQILEFNLTRNNLFLFKHFLLSNKRKCKCRKSLLCSFIILINTFLLYQQYFQLYI